MSKVNGIYAATLSVLNDDLSLNIKKTINHAENVMGLGCHGAVFFGSTGQSQLISLSDKIQMINNLPGSQHKEKFIIGSGLNSLGDTINLMSISLSNKLNKFLIMPPAYYKYQDDDVINFYSKIIEALPESEIILYNFFFSSFSISHVLCRKVYFLITVFVGNTSINQNKSWYYFASIN